MSPDIVILPSFTQVEHWRKHNASTERAGLFSQTITTFNAWIADLWELHGDGRVIVDSLQRRMIMQAAFDEAVETRTADGGEGPEDPEGQDALTLSPGVVKLATQCVRSAAGVPAFERAVAEAFGGSVPDGLSAREAVVLGRIGRYYEMLEQAGLVEVGHACAALADDADTVFPKARSVLVAQASPLDWRTELFFEACGALDVTVELAPGAAGIGPVPDGVELRFGFPSGRYAQPALVADIVREAQAKGEATDCEVDVVVACKDPLALYKQIEPTLVQAGVAGCVQASVSFSSTDFGRQFLSLCRVLEQDAWSKEDLSDAARPPFSGFDAVEATNIDRALRADRIAVKEDYLGILRSSSDTFSQFEELVSDPEADILLGVFEQIAFTAPGRSFAWKNEQISAASAVRSCTKAARSVGASMRSVARVLEDVKVTVSFETVHSEQGASSQAPLRVVATTQAVAAQMGARSCRELVLADFTSDDYPVADRDDAAATLFEKLGLLPTDTMLARSRRTFAMLQQVPAVRMTCLRPLNDWDGNPTYPAAMLQELIDAYRADPSSRDDVDETYGLPERFRPTMLQRGEELLFSNAVARPTASDQPIEGFVEHDFMGSMSSDAASKVALPRRLPDGSAFVGFSPSPSQVEMYLDCPYKWFAQRRLGIEGLDEEFGPLERGSFAHGVLQRFYQEFSEMGYKKVNGDNIGEARTLLRRIAEDEARAQRDLEPGSGRFVAANQIEQRELVACIDQLVSYLDFEARFLPTFYPAYLEYEIGPQAGVEYGGHPFMGIVDRIDVDDAGNAVIVDYKGSVGAAHEIAGKGQNVPGKVQTRMYARAVERALGLNVIGAFYVSYGATHGCAGAFDGRSIEAAHLPGARVERCSCATASPAPPDQVEDFSQLTFADMLDSTEALVGDAIERMAAGEVEPNPATPDSCAYCPVIHCPKGKA